MVQGLENANENVSRVLNVIYSSFLVIYFLLENDCESVIENSFHSCYDFVMNSYCVKESENVNVNLN